MAAELLSQRTYVPNVKSKYFNLVELLHNALLVRVAEVYSQRTYGPNVRSTYFNIAEL